MPRVDFRPLNLIQRVCLSTLALVTLELVCLSEIWGEVSRHSLYLQAPDMLPGVLAGVR